MRYTENDKMDAINNIIFVFADSNGRQWRDRDIQAKRSIGFECASDKHIRSSSWCVMSGRDKEPKL